MNPDYRAMVCVHGGWFEPVAYLVNILTAVMLLYLLVQNARALWSGGTTTAMQAGIRFRLLLSKRLTQLLGLFCAFQLCNFFAYVHFILAIPDSQSHAAVAAMTYSYRPIGLTFAVVAAGMIQYGVLDAILKRRELRENQQRQ